MAEASHQRANAFDLAAAVIVGNQIAAEPVESVTGLLLVIAGLPVYYFCSR